MAARIQRRVPAANRAASRPADAQSRGGGEEGSAKLVKRKVPMKHLVRFTRLFATLTEAGLPVLRNLKILADQWPEGRFRDSVLDAADMVEEGQPLSESLSQHPEVFDELYVNMTRAGEAGGVLDAVLERLAGFMERSQSLRERTRSAMIYPVFVVGVAFLVVGALMVFVIPKFTQLFEEMDLELPVPTRVLIAISDTFKDYWYLVFGIPALIFLLYQIAYFRSFGFRRWNHGMALRLPIIGKLTRTGQISRFATTFGTLVTSGVPHLRAFEIVRGALTNEHFRETVDDVRAGVREGEPIAASMDTTEMFDEVVVSMVEVGEETGELDRMCLRVGQNYEDNFNRGLDGVLKLIEPVLLLVLAAVVAGIALAMLLPLFELLERLGEVG